RPERLPPPRRAALLLRIDQDLDYPEIAEVMGWALHKVKNEIHRARIAIRSALRGDLARGRPPARRSASPGGASRERSSLHPRAGGDRGRRPRSGAHGEVRRLP